MSSTGERSLTSAMIRRVFTFLISVSKCQDSVSPFSEVFLSRRQSCHLQPLRPESIGVGPDPGPNHHLPIEGPNAIIRPADPLLHRPGPEEARSPRYRLPAVGVSDPNLRTITLVVVVPVQVPGTEATGMIRYLAKSSECLG